MSSSLPASVRVTVIRGNIVTLKALVYGGYVEVVNDTIAAIEPAGTPIPSAEQIQEKYSEGGKRMVVFTVSEAHGGFILPGFIDIHNHGVGGATEVLDHWKNPDVSRKYLAQRGTLSTLASVIFSTTRAKAVEEVIASIESVVGKVEKGKCVIEGIHAEGPIIADPGGLPPSQAEITDEQFSSLCDKMPSMKIMTIAPSKESASNYSRMRMLLERGVRPSMGHDRTCSEKVVLGAMHMAAKFVKETGASNKKDKKLSGEGGDNTQWVPTEGETGVASPVTTTSDGISGPPTKTKQIEEGKFAPNTSQLPVNTGSSTYLPPDVLHTTHFCNVMGFHHRHPSLVNFSLCSSFPRAQKYNGIKPVTTEVIADLIHLHPVTIQALLSARAPEHVAVITDCISTYEPGRRLTYTNRGIVVRAEGGCYLTDSKGKPTQTLAGSTVTMADEFYTLVKHFGLDLVTTCRLLSTTPASIANINHVGAIEVGRKANLLIIDPELQTITNRMIYGIWAEGMDPYRMLRPSPSHL